ncbi:hypothetical protein AB4099_05595 [Bosea sp. 2KB_26]|uniref:hypothetical protein n=1 Tax=Bosea sp. 2KB_26 TaxID=3237475 RepID=UPI003F93A80E
MAIELTLDTILKVAGLGGVAAGVTNQLLKWGVDAYTERTKKQSDAVYAAVRAVVALERYVLQSEAHLSDREFEQERGRIDDAGDLPKLDALPLDINWRAFDTEFAFGVLGFPAKIEEAQANCDRYAWESNDYWHSEGEAKRLGLAAWELAVAIRQRYRLGANKEVGETVPLLRDRKMEQAARRGRRLAEWSDARRERGFVHPKA